MIYVRCYVCLKPLKYNTNDISRHMEEHDESSHPPYDVEEEKLPSPAGTI